MYQELYTIISNYIYEGVELTPYMELVCTNLATLGSVVVTALPLVIVFWLTKFVFTLGREW